MSYVTINIPFDYIEANIVIDCLRRHKVDCFLADEHSAAAAFAPTIVTPRIMVNEKDLEQAQKIINDFLAKS